MTMEGFSVNQCVDEILCGEQMELEGVQMSYECEVIAGEEAGATKLIASAASLLILSYALWILITKTKKYHKIIVINTHLLPKY